VEHSPTESSASWLPFLASEFWQGGHLLANSATSSFSSREGLARRPTTSGAIFRPARFGPAVKLWSLQSKALRRTVIRPSLGDDGCFAEMCYG